MIKRILVGMLLGITLFSSCDKFWGDFTPTEEDWKNMMSTNVEFNYFLARGFNLKFIGVLASTEDIMNGGTSYQFDTNISLNIDNILIVSNNDVITKMIDTNLCGEISI